MGKLRSIRFVIDSNLELTPLVGKAVKGICSSIPISDQEMYEMELCIVEAINNVIMHAYENEEGHQIEVDFHLGNDHILVKTYDSGRSGNPLTIEEKFKYFDPEDFNQIPESGMGIFIMKSFMDEVSYDTEKGRNVVTMRKNLNEKIGEEENGIVNL